MEIIIIAATDLNNVIGFENKIPWRLPLDFKRFKSTTMGHPLIMGRKTLESLPGILPGRKHVVISNTITTHENPEVEIASSFEKAIEYAKSLNTGKVFIAGGQKIFEEGLKIADKLMLTIVLSQKYKGDAFFPKMNDADWEIASYEHHINESKHSDDFYFYDLQRK